MVLVKCRHESSRSRRRHHASLRCRHERLADPTPENPDNYDWWRLREYEDVRTAIAPTLPSAPLSLVVVLVER